MDNEAINWLLESNPWTKYAVFKNIVKADPSILKEAKEELLNDEKIKGLIAELKDWYPDRYTRHNDPKISHYKLMLLAELGIDKDDPGIKEIITKVKEHMDDGQYAMKQCLPVKGGESPEGWHALPCDSPIILYTLLLLGDRSEVTLNAARILYEKWQDPEGWFCNFSFVNGQYKKLKAACPMAGLMALQVFSLIDKYRESVSATNAFNSLVYHKELGKNLYYFGRSKKFWTFKYPFVWYNALYMAEVVNKFPQFRDTELFKELYNWIKDTLDSSGNIKPTSMFRIYKDWDFADKKYPSPWLTYKSRLITKI